MLAWEHITSVSVLATIGRQVCVCVCLDNNLGDTPRPLILPPVATYTDEASSCPVWPTTTAWIGKLSPHTELCTKLPSDHCIHSHTYTTVAGAAVVTYIGVMPQPLFRNPRFWIHRLARYLLGGVCMFLYNVRMAVSKEVEWCTLSAVTLTAHMYT